MGKKFQLKKKVNYNFCLISDEIMFVFGEPLNATDSKLYKYEEIQLARRIMGYWSNFAKYG
jgi:carboxylesterase type B